MWADLVLIAGHQSLVLYRVFPHRAGGVRGGWRLLEGAETRKSQLKKLKVTYQVSPKSYTSFNTEQSTQYLVQPGLL